MQIYTDEWKDLKEGLAQITKRWVRNDEYCEATVESLRDACLSLLNQVNEPRNGGGSLDDQLSKLAEPNWSVNQRWETLSIILRRIALAQGINLDYVEPGK